MHLCDANDDGPLWPFGPGGAPLLIRFTDIHSGMIEGAGTRQDGQFAGLSVGEGDLLGVVRAEFGYH